MAIFGVNCIPEGTKVNFTTNFCGPQVTRETFKAHSRVSANATRGAGAWRQKIWGTGASAKKGSGALWDVRCGCYSPEATV